MPNFTSLPPELLLEVVSHLHNPEDIRHFRLLSVRCACLARPLLFRHFGSSDRPASIHSVRRFLRILSKEPKLAKLTEYASVNWGFGDNDSHSDSEFDADMVIWDREVQDLNLRKNHPLRRTYWMRCGIDDGRDENIRLDHCYNKACIPLLLCKLPNLKTLEVVSAAIGWSSRNALWEGILNVFPALENLSWRSGSRKRYHINCIVPIIMRAPRLRSVSAAGCYGDRLQEIPTNTYFLPHTTGSITSLELSPSWLHPTSLDVLLQMAPKLVSFKSHHVAWFQVPLFWVHLLHVQDTLEVLELRVQRKSNIPSVLSRLYNFPRLKRLVADLNLVYDSSLGDALDMVLPRGLEYLEPVNGIYLGCPQKCLEAMKGIVKAKADGRMLCLKEVRYPPPPVDHPLYCPAEDARLREELKKTCVMYEVLLQYG